MGIQWYSGGDPFEPDLARRIYNYALDYDYSWAVLFDAAHHRTTIHIATTPYTIPIFVVSSFCIELYLKSLLAIHSIEIPNKHELQALFNLLPMNIQTEIADNHDAPSSLDDLRKPKIDEQGVPFPAGFFDIKNVLERLNKAFVKWRYAYENKADLIFAGSEHLRDAIVKCIRKLKPDWPTLEQKHGARPTFLTH